MAAWEWQRKMHLPDRGTRHHWCIGPLASDPRRSRIHPETRCPSPPAPGWASDPTPRSQEMPRPARWPWGRRPPSPPGTRRYRRCARHAQQPIAADPKDVGRLRAQRGTSMALLVSQLGPQGRAGHAGRGAVRPGTLGHGTVEMPADLPPIYHPQLTASSSRKEALSAEKRPGILRGDHGPPGLRAEAVEEAVARQRSACSSTVCRKDREQLPKLYRAPSSRHNKRL